jgi:hypothetical protein
MISRFVTLTFFAVMITVAAAIGAYAQPDMPDATTSRPGGRRSIDAPKDLKAMLAKQRAERDKKDHKEMLERGDQALRLANQLEASFAEKNDLTAEDKARLESLQDVVEKIRKELGGDDDGGVDDPSYMKPVDEPRPSTVEEAFKYLHTTTVKLVDELKKTTRFTISAVAIQTSNNVIRLVKFLRFRK